MVPEHDTESGPLVSVIIPNYNHRPFLEKRIETVLNQTYSNFELIILDDSSTDGSKDFILKYRSHPRVVRIEFNVKNSGSPFMQWEKGMDLASGELIWVAESDDFADREFLQTTVGIMESDSGLGMVYCDSYIVRSERIHTETFADIKNLKFNSERWSNNHRNNGINEIENYLLGQGTINNSSAVLFRKEALLGIKPIDEGFFFMGDKFVFIKVLSKWDIAYVAKPLNYYRAADNALPKHTQNFLDYTFEHFKIFDWVLRNMEIDQSTFNQAFHANVTTSLVWGWNLRKLHTFREMSQINCRLFRQFLSGNFRRSLRKILS